MAWLKVVATTQSSSSAGNGLSVCDVVSNTANGSCKWKECAHLASFAGDLKGLVDDLQRQTIIKREDSLEHATKILGKLLDVEILQLKDLVDDQAQRCVQHWKKDCQSSLIVHAFSVKGPSHPSLERGFVASSLPLPCTSARLCMALPF
jgi:hypothetical protein